MKKLLLLAICILGTTVQLQAQEISKNALGLRFGGSNGVGTEITYQRGLSTNNRLEIDLGWNNREDVDAFRLTGLYHWVWQLEDRFNWYAGVGAGIGSVDYVSGSEVFLSAAGNVGIEYDFDFPLLISLDFRPEIGLANYYGDDLGFDIALAIKYQF
ncbi:hypothetical protein [Salinimicrobium sp. GXAS 041]|uniref:hypothetical protein n=1 Tax=Salinimicrobium sp. GXAS 041 TaxID=3400806 RepID=UPI003C714265